MSSVDRLRNFSFLMRDVMRLMTRNFEAHTQELGLTLPQCKIMAYLSRNAGITQARLAELPADSEERDEIVRDLDWNETQLRIAQRRGGASR